MKKFVLVLTVILFACIISCKKEKEAQISQKSEIAQLSKEEFAILCAEKADEIGLTGSIVFVTRDDQKVDGKKEKVNVTVFKEVWGFTELQPVLKEIPLTVKIWESGPGLLVKDYTDFFGYKNRVDAFRVLPPRPKYIVNYLETGETFYIKEDYSLWNKRVR